MDKISNFTRIQSSISKAKASYQAGRLEEYAPLKFSGTSDVFSRIWQHGSHKTADGHWGVMLKK